MLQLPLRSIKIFLHRVRITFDPKQAVYKMTAIDSKVFLTEGGYLQKGIEVNIREIDLVKKVADLLPSR